VLAFTAALVVLVSFCAGYVSRSPLAGGLFPARAEQTFVASAARANALGQLDEALRAKHEKRMHGSLAALDRARRTDASLPGIDVSLATMALEEKRLSEMQAAALTGAKNGTHSSAANVLLGLGKWIERGPSDQDLASSADAASIYFAEAVEADYSHPEAWFFWGDVERYAGRERSGSKRVLAAMRRFDPWDSSDVLVAKIVFALAESDPSAPVDPSVVHDSLWGRSVQRLLGTPESGRRAALLALSAYAAQRTLESLSDDPALRPFDGVTGGAPRPQ